MYKILIENDRPKKTTSITEEQHKRLNQFIKKSAGYYGGLILEITNLINNKRTISEILQQLSMIDWKIFDFKILEDFLLFAESIDYIEL